MYLSIDICRGEVGTQPSSQDNKVTSDRFDTRYERISIWGGLNVFNMQFVCVFRNAETNVKYRGTPLGGAEIWGGGWEDVAAQKSCTLHKFGPLDPGFERFRSRAFQNSFNHVRIFSRSKAMAG